MKKVLLPLALFCAIQVSAQNVTIPDANFKAALLAHIPKIDIDNDNEISIFEAKACTTKVSVSSKNISDLTGIEAFEDLTNLECYNNKIASLDLSKNVFLKELNCSYNQLTSLDLTNNTALTTIDCSSNQISNLNVSNCSNLIKLKTDSNKLSLLNLSNNLSLKELYCANNELVNIDLIQNVSLWILSCENNQLITLDISKNVALTSLYTHNNKLSSLDLSTNLLIKFLFCGYNQLTSLDVSKLKLIAFNSTQNLNLKTICIYSGQNTATWQKDKTTFYSTTCKTITAIEEDFLVSTAVPIAAYNLNMQEVPLDSKNQLLIIRYSDGTVKKVINK